MPDLTRVGAPSLGFCRIRISIHTRAREIPWDEWLRPGRSLLYSWLHKQNPQLSSELHRSLRMAPFGYSAPMFPQAQPQPGVYAAGGHGVWEIGTIQRQVAKAWLQTLESKPLLNWGGVALTVTGWEVMRPPRRIGTGRVTFTTATPVVVRTTEELLRVVPNELREASYALGVRKWRTIIKVVIPTAISGLPAAITSLNYLKQIVVTKGLSYRFAKLVEEIRPGLGGGQ